MQNAGAKPPDYKEISLVINYAGSQILNCSKCYLCALLGHIIIIKTIFDISINIDANIKMYKKFVFTLTLLSIQTVYFRTPVY